MRHRCSIFLSLLLAVPCAALATPITYTISGLGNGTLGGTAFKYADVTFTETSDTNTIITVYRSADGDEGYFTNAGILNVSISGVGSTTLSSNFGFFCGFINSLDAALFGIIGEDPSGAGAIGALELDYSGQLQGYDLSTAFGPNGDDMGGARSEGTLTGTGGDLYLSYLEFPEASATLGPVAATPEPSSLVLLGTGMLGLVTVARRRLGMLPRRN